MLGGSLLSDGLKAHLREQLHALARSRLLFLKKPERALVRAPLLSSGRRRPAPSASTGWRSTTWRSSSGFDFAAALAGDGVPVSRSTTRSSSSAPTGSGIAAVRSTASRSTTRCGARRSGLGLAVHPRRRRPFRRQRRRLPRGPLLRPGRAGRRRRSWSSTRGAADRPGALPRPVPPTRSPSRRPSTGSARRKACSASTTSPSGVAGRWGTALARPLPRGRGRRLRGGRHRRARRASRSTAPAAQQSPSVRATSAPRRSAGTRVENPEEALANEAADEDEPPRLIEALPAGRRAGTAPRPRSRQSTSARACSGKRSSLPSKTRPTPSPSSSRSAITVLRRSTGVPASRRSSARSCAEAVLADRPARVEETPALPALHLLRRQLRPSRSASSSASLASRATTRPQVEAPARAARAPPWPRRSRCRR